jgi:hypothetical protein
VPQQAPSLAILHPRENYHYEAGQTLRLWATSASPVERLIDPSWYAWKLDGSEIGHGNDLWIRAPRMGGHVLTLTLMDPDVPATQEIRFTTTATPKPPRRRR